MLRYGCDKWRWSFALAFAFAWPSFFYLFMRVCPLVARWMPTMKTLGIVLLLDMYKNTDTESQHQGRPCASIIARRSASTDRHVLAVPGGCLRWNDFLRGVNAFRRATSS